MFKDENNIVRKQQHELIAHYQVQGMTVGDERNKRLRIFPKS